MGKLKIDAGPVTARPARWQAVYLVCSACRKRRHGPRDLKPKALAKAIRSESKREPARARIVMTGCLGLCPKEAGAVARAASNGVHLVAVRERADVAGALAALSASVAQAKTAD